MFDIFFESWLWLQLIGPISAALLLLMVLVAAVFGTLFMWGVIWASYTTIKAALTIRSTHLREIVAVLLGRGNEAFASISPRKRSVNRLFLDVRGIKDEDVSTYAVIAKILPFIEVENGYICIRKEYVGEATDFVYSVDDGLSLRQTVKWAKKRYPAMFEEAKRKREETK